MTGMDLSRAKLSGARLRGADLSGARLPRANLSGSDLTGANLAGADLSDANLSRANLSAAHLVGARLSHANLRLASLIGAAMSHANLAGAEPHRRNLDGWVKVRAKVCRGVQVSALIGILAVSRYVVLLHEGVEPGTGEAGYAAGVFDVAARDAHEVFEVLALRLLQGGFPEAFQGGQRGRGCGLAGDLAGASFVTAARARLTLMWVGRCLAKRVGSWRAMVRALSTALTSSRTLPGHS